MMPSRIFFWIAALLLCGVLAIALPMHPALRLALGFATFCLLVGTVVEFVNRSNGPDVIPGSRSAAQLAVDIDEVSARLADLQERIAVQEAAFRSEMSEVQVAVTDGFKKQDLDLLARIEKSASDVHARMDSVTEHIVRIDKQTSMINPAKLLEEDAVTRAMADRIYLAADDVFAAQALIPEFSALLEELRVEAKRRPMAREIAARDNFLNERVSSAKRTVALAKDLIDVADFDGKTDARSMGLHISELISRGQAQFSSDSEIKSWVRSQARVIGMEQAIARYLASLESLVDFAGRVRARRVLAGDIQF